MGIKLKHLLIILNLMFCPLIYGQNEKPIVNIELLGLNGIELTNRTSKQITHQQVSKITGIKAEVFIASKKITIDSIYFELSLMGGGDYMVYNFSQFDLRSISVRLDRMSKSNSKPAYLVFFVTKIVLNDGRAFSYPEMFKRQRRDYRYNNNTYEKKIAGNYVIFDDDTLSASKFEEVVKQEKLLIPKNNKARRGYMNKKFSGTIFDGIFFDVL